MTRSRAFLFGKLPAHGDFVSRGLSPAQRESWDDWLSRAVSLARGSLGDRFDDAWFTLPPRRFALGPGSLGQGWRAGVLAASIDSAGRRFPIVLGRDGRRGPEGCASIAARCEALLYEHLGQADADAFVAMVDDAQDGDAENGGADDGNEAREGWWIADVEGTLHWLSGAETPDDLLILESVP